MLFLRVNFLSVLFFALFTTMIFQAQKLRWWTKIDKYQVRRRYYLGERAFNRVGETGARQVRRSEPSKDLEADERLRDPE